MCDCGTRWSARVAGPCTKGAKMPPVREHDASLTRQQQAPHREARLTPKWKRTAPNRQGGKLFCQPVAAQHLYTRKLPAACTQCYLCGENTQMSSPLRIMSIIRSFNSEAGQCLREGASKSLSGPALGNRHCVTPLICRSSIATTKRSERIKRHEPSLQPGRQLEVDAGVHSPKCHGSVPYWPREFWLPLHFYNSAYTSGMPY